MNIQVLKAASGSAVLLFTSVLLYGCMATWHVRTNCEFPEHGNHTCTVEGGVEGNFLTGGPIQVTDIQAMKMLAEPVNIYLTTSSGSILLKVSDATGLIGAKTFAYYRNGQYLYMTNPSAVSGWLNAFSAITSVDYEIRDMKYGYAESFVPGTGDIASLKVTAYYNDEAIISGKTYISDPCDSPFAWKIPQCDANPWDL